MKPNQKPTMVIHAVIGNNNRLENINSITEIDQYEKQALQIENEKLKSALNWAITQLRIKDTIITNILQNE